MNIEAICRVQGKNEKHLLDKLNHPLERRGLPHRQESVANAVKHARPGRITISLDCGLDRRLTLVVADDGIGRRDERRNEPDAQHQKNIKGRGANIGDNRWASSRNGRQRS